ncbi:TIC 20-I, chloroplastic-like [Olea europaea subsp. europaea]|uniref:Protein TIC 20 n=1 Tax=Olea europaea subsp. europaea TaxID=158383 RepID=A0A8S0TZS3_OLEEU|nr:TIC 20-I, chloroplastic-like [Olea europaea subsp. europaea]
MILKGCSVPYSGAIPLPYSYKPSVLGIHKYSSSWKPLQNLKDCSLLETKQYSLSTTSTSPFNQEKGLLSLAIPKLSKHPRFLLSPRATKDDVPYSFRYPEMTKKPKWWWRILSCLPYLMPLHLTVIHAETAYNLHPFLEYFELLTVPFWQSFFRLPTWFTMAYFLIAFITIVRRKEWPHFFRFHVILGMLLEITMQVIGTVNSWTPLALYWGKVGMHFWVATAFAYLFTVLECIRCALAGMYADVPFLCDAAYIQIPYN